MNEPPPSDPTTPRGTLRPVALDYARPEPKRLPAWATRPLSLEGAVLIWVMCSVGFRFVETRAFTRT